MPQFHFEAEVIHWRGPAPFYFARIPAEISAEIGAFKKSLTYGWGVIPVEAVIDGVRFSTSLFPKDGGYLLPLKDAVRRKIAVPATGSVAVDLTLGRAEAA
jgi:hypothetical protein